MMYLRKIENIYSQQEAALTTNVNWIVPIIREWSQKIFVPSTVTL